MDARKEPLRMPSKPLRAVVFDLDDTLVVSTVDFPKFKGLVLDRIAESGDDRSAYDMSETIVTILERFEGRMRAKGVSGDRLKGMMSELDRIMDEVELERVGETSPIAGAAETLSFLRSKGLRIGILTRGCEAYAREAMRRTGIDRFVDAVECRNSDARPKPYPDSYLRLVAALGVSKEETVFVGDHAIDARCAENAGVPFIGVGTGDVPERVLVEAGATMFLKDVGELTERLRPFLPD